MIERDHVPRHRFFFGKLADPRPSRIAGGTFCIRAIERVLSSGIRQLHFVAFGKTRIDQNGSATFAFVDVDVEGGGSFQSSVVRGNGDVRNAGEIFDGTQEQLSVFHLRIHISVVFDPEDKRISIGVGEDLIQIGQPVARKVPGQVLGEYRRLQHGRIVVGIILRYGDHVAAGLPAN